MGVISGDGMLRVLLQFSRAKEAGDPFGFRFEPQDYILQTPGGATPGTRFEWTSEVLDDLEAVRRPGRSPSVVQRIGEQLRAFVPAEWWGEWEREITEAIAARRPVFLTIRSSAAELYALPWELLTLKTGQFIGELDGLLLRFEWPDSESSPEQPKPRSEGGRILLAWSGAGGAVPAADHLKAIARACELGAHPFSASADVLAHASLLRITKRLEEAERQGEPVSVLHLLCHGAEAGDTFGLALDGEQGQAVVDATQLRQQLAPFAKQVRLVVLSACDSGNFGELGNRLGSVAHALHRCGFQSVIASRFPLSVGGSIALTETLYRELLCGPSSLETAFLSARKSLAKRETELPQEERKLDWASVQLYARLADGDDTRPVVFRPYRGLLAFQPEHRRFFFGRDKEVAEILTDLQALVDRNQARFLVVAGASGTGKSSLVLAGAVPKLLAARPGLAFLRMRPGKNPEEALTAALSKRPASAPALLVVDQFEEVFTQTPFPKDRETFLRHLWSLASSPDSGLVIIITLRVDFIGRCGELAVNDDGLRLDRIAYDEAHRIFVAQLGPDQLRASIEEPAHTAGLELQAGLADRILAELGAEPGALPLLEDALDMLWQQRQDRTLTQRAYHALGGVVGALQKRADALVEKLAPNEQALVQRLLVSLVAVADDTALDSRLRVPVAELRQSVAAADGPGFDRVLKVLVDARLLVHDDNQSPTVEVAHEALIRKWPRLRAWIDEDRAGLVVQRRVKQAAQLWDKQQRDDSLLFRGAQLAQATEWRKLWESRLGAQDRSFLDASEALRRKQEQDDANRLRQTRVAATVLAVLLVGASGAGGLAYLNAEEAKKNAEVAKHNAEEAKNNAELAKRNAEVARTKAAESRATLLVALAQNGKEDSAKVVTLLREPGHQASTLWRQSALEVLQTGISELSLRGHEAAVTSVAVSPDGKMIATGSNDHIARLYQADGSGPPLVFQGHEDSITSVAISPDGKKLVTGSNDNTARIFPLHGSGAALVLKGHTGAVTSVAISPDGKKIVTGSWDNTARVFLADGSGSPIVLKGHNAPVSAVAVSPNGTKIVTGSWDKTVRIYNSDGSGAPRVLKGHEESVLSVAVSPDGTKIVTGSWDKTVRLFAADGSGAPLLLKRFDAVVLSVAVSPDGKRVVAVTADKTARVFPIDGTGAPLVLRGHEDRVTSAAFSPDGKKIVTGSEDKTAQVWNADGSRAALVLKEHDAHVLSVAVSPDGKKVVTGSADKIARIFSADGSGATIELIGHAASVTAAAFSPNGKMVVTGSNDKTARIFRTDGFGAALVLTGHASPVSSVAFSPDGKKVVTGGWDKMARVYNTDGSGTPIVLAGHDGIVSAVAFGPDGSKIVTGSGDRTARIFSADGSGTPLLLTGHADAIHSVAFSPDGKKVVTGSGDKTARIFQADGSGAPIVLKGHESSVTSVAFSFDGKVVVTGSGDKIARLFSADGSGTPLLLKGHEATVTSIAIFPDGKKLVTGSRDKTARVWTIDSDLLDDALWNATSACLPERRRQELLAESPAEAQQGHARCQQEVARRRAWSMP